eukprot:scaffold4251_cov430-Prasinococcus_capsulatus_cf.AAC.2
MGSSAVTSRIRRIQPSKSVSMESTRALFAIGCTSWASEIFSDGRNTIAGMLAAAQYADKAAEVSPVEAQPTATIGRTSLGTPCRSAPPRTDWSCPRTCSLCPRPRFRAAPTPSCSTPQIRTATRSSPLAGRRGLSSTQRHR